MKILYNTVALIFLGLSMLSAADTITYSYDAQHRLVQENISASEKVFYSYDSAGNTSQHVTITDAKYLESWLLYFSMLEPWQAPGVATVLRDVRAAMLAASQG
ncbi:MAG: hypothetical protein R6X19_04005 [Kiritimatiellia bacterium]